MKFASLVVAAAMMMSLPAGIAGAATHYVAPSGASAACSGAQGSQTCPWGSVDKALASGKVAGGDVLLLMPGDYGQLLLQSRRFGSAPVTIRSQTGRTAHIENILLRSTEGFVFENLSLWLPDGRNVDLIFADKDSTKLVFQNLDMKCRKDISGLMQWTQADWSARKCNAAVFFSSFTRFLNNTATGVNMGFLSAGSDNEMTGNRVENFSGDGMRAGTRTLVKNNYIANAFRIDDNHPDGFQSVGPVNHLTLDGNTILEWAHEQDHPLRTSLQGIGLFDGYYDDLVIRNNVVAVSAHHGIAVYGTRRAQIVNNTVTTIDGNPRDYPWIMVTTHKDGSPSSDVKIGNNLAMRFSGDSSVGPNISLFSNQVVLYPVKTYRDVTKFDYRLKTDSAMKDIGNASAAPALDIVGTPRPQGAGPDLGAYEEGSEVAGDGGATDSGSTDGGSAGTGGTDGGSSGTGTTDAGTPSNEGSTGTGGTDGGASPTPGTTDGGSAGTDGTNGGAPSTGTTTDGSAGSSSGGTTDSGSTGGTGGKKWGYKGSKKPLKSVELLLESYNSAPIGQRSAGRWLRLCRYTKTGC